MDASGEYPDPGVLGLPDYRVRSLSYRRLFGPLSGQGHSRGKDWQTNGDSSASATSSRTSSGVILARSRRRDALFSTGLYGGSGRLFESTPVPQ